MDAMNPCLQLQEPVRCPVNMSLVDRRMRPLKDLRISVTDRCNFRCSYCMPREHFGTDHAFLPKDELLSYEEIVFVVRSLLPVGLEKVRLTGGEPLLRNDLINLIQMIRLAAPEVDLAMTTNGALLAKHAPSLVEAGLDRVTVSLDAIEPKVFAAMADTDKFTAEDVVEAIDAALDVGLKVKVNAVIRKHLNEDQILSLAEMCTHRKVPLRFVEYMDVGNTNAWKMEEVVSGRDVRSKLEQRFGPLSPELGQNVHEVARRYTSAKGDVFGFINSVTEPFCGDCSRARLSANGSLYTCLFANNGHDVRALLRMGASQAEIQQAIASIWSSRTDQYSVERGKNSSDASKVEMSFIGG